MKRYDYSRTTSVKPLFSTPSGRFVYYDEAQAEIDELVDMLEETKMHLNPRWAKEKLGRVEALIAKHRGE